MLSVTENPAVAQVVSFYLRHNDWFAARFLGRFHQWLTKNGPGNSRATSSSSSSSSFLSAATEDPAQTRKRYREEYQHSSVLLLSLHSHALSLRLAVASIHACDLCSKSLYGAGYQCDQCTFDLCLDCFDATTSAPMSTTATTTTTAPAASAISNLAKDASSVARPSVMPGPEMPSIEDTFHALKQDMLNGLTRISNIDRHEYVLVKNCLDDRARFAALAIKFIDLASRMIDKEEQQKEDDSNGTDPKQSGNAIKKNKYLFANKTLPEISDASSSGILRNKKARFDVFNSSQTKSSSKATPTERKMDMYQHQDDGEKTEQELKNADEEGREEEENVEALFEEDSYRIVEVALTGMTSFLQESFLNELMTAHVVRGMSLAELATVEASTLFQRIEAMNTDRLYWDAFDKMIEEEKAALRIGYTQASASSTATSLEPSADIQQLTSALSDLHKSFVHLDKKRDKEKSQGKDKEKESSDIKDDAKPSSSSATATLTTFRAFIAYDVPYTVYLIEKARKEQAAELENARTAALQQQQRQDSMAQRFALKTYTYFEKLSAEEQRAVREKKRARIAAQLAASHEAVTKPIAAAAGTTAIVDEKVGEDNVAVGRGRQTVGEGEGQATKGPALVCGSATPSKSSSSSSSSSSLALVSTSLPVPAKAHVSQSFTLSVQQIAVLSAAVSVGAYVGDDRACQLLVSFLHLCEENTLASIHLHAWGEILNMPFHTDDHWKTKLGAAVLRDEAQKLLPKCPFHIRNKFHAPTVDNGGYILKKL